MAVLRGFTANLTNPRHLKPPSAGGLPKELIILALASPSAQAKFSFFGFFAWSRPRKSSFFLYTLKN
jgi:hypothetical protein